MDGSVDTHRTNLRHIHALEIGGKTMREKLIELLADSEYLSYEAKADHLIANGVTIAKWIPVTERLPEDEKKVLCILDDGFFCILEWKSWDWLWDDGHNVYAEKDVTHWMPLPEPPKGE